MTNQIRKADISINRNDVRELTTDELDAVAGGDGIIETAAGVIATFLTVLVLTSGSGTGCPSPTRR